MRKYENKEQNGLNNKGFSLVELIIVVAIMAVLIAVLAPQYLRYVERTRIQRDNSAISEIANSIKIASAEEDVIVSIPTGGEVINTTRNGGGTTGNQIFTFDGATTALTQELEITLGERVETTSRAYSNGADLSILVEVDGNGIVTVTVRNWIDPDGTAVANQVL